MNTILIILSIVLGILVLLLIAGRLKKTILRRQNPPPGERVDIGGYSLHYISRGQGSPVVVLDAGAGEFSLMWHNVQEQLAVETRVVSYDRAGLGWSDLNDTPRTNIQMVEELHEMLKNAGIPGPYLLVGASLGGLNMKIFAHRYPVEVAGLVLVDAAHEEQYQPPELQEAMQRMQGMMAVMSAVQKAMASSGLTALFPRLMPGSLPKSIPEDTRKAHQAVRVAYTRHTIGALKEIEAVMESHASIREQGINDLGNLPLIVIQHGKPQAQMMPGVDEIMEETNRRLQKATAELSNSGKFVIAQNSGHDVVGDEPELVVQTVHEILMMTRSRQEIQLEAQVQA